MFLFIVYYEYLWRLKTGLVFLLILVAGHENKIDEENMGNVVKKTIFHKNVPAPLFCVQNIFRENGF